MRRNFWERLSSLTQAHLGSEKEETTMDAIMGRYRVRMEESGLVLTHPSGISFDMTADEALDLLDFLKVYRQTLLISERETNPELERITERETNPELKRIVIEEREN